MSSPSTFPTRILPAALIAIAVLVLADQSGELAVRLGAWKIGDPHWRFGAFGLAIDRATIVVLADAMLLIAIVIRRSSRVLKGWAVVHLVMAVALAAGLLLFGLDAIEIRRTVIPAAADAFATQSIRAAGIGTLLVGYCGWAGIGGLWAARAKRHHDHGQVGLVVGSRGALK